MLKVKWRVRFTPNPPPFILSCNIFRLMSEEVRTSVDYPLRAPLYMYFAELCGSSVSVSFSKWKDISIEHYSTVQGKNASILKKSQLI